MQVLIEDEILCLIPYTHDDDLELYKCYKDKHSILGFNYKLNGSFDQFQKMINIDLYPFWATILHKSTQKKIGCVRLSPFASSPDLSIWIYKRYRRHGYGRCAYCLALRYCFFELGFTEILANCYEDYEAGRRFLETLHFTRNPSHDLNERSVVTGKLVKQLGYQMTNIDFVTYVYK